MKHLGLKITAFLFAIALWLYVMSLNTFQITMDVPVRLVKLPEMLAIASKPPQAITITVEGEAFDLMRMRSRINRGDSSVASIVVDLQDAELGASRKHIYARNFVAPSFPNIKFIEPDNQLLFIDIELDTRIERDIPVHSNVTFNTASGYLLSDEPTLSPNFVTVSGARNALTRIFEIPTDSIHFDTLKGSRAFSVPLNFNQFPAYVSPSDSNVTIKVNVQKIATKEFKNIPVHLIGRYDKSLVKLNPDTVSVNITGGSDILDSISSEDIELFIEFNRFAIEDVDSLTPTVKLKLDAKINRDLSIKATEIVPDKIALVRKEVKPVVPVQKSNEDYGEEEDEEDDEE
ncbi:YbbR-like domain-containing protein [Fibrobacter sp. UBA4309]|uniref:YbbR-like domain-containing protein n=1 Tax=Fibrobacter sp. UBA4309 TaxID=1946537 RepID=UPI0025C0652B|nr:YbbR-like domain-containing protein [Fibrobacter sp. UBA4309]